MMEINEIDVRNSLIKEYITADEVALLGVEDVYVTLTGKVKTEPAIYGEKTRQELFAQVKYRSTGRETWLKLTNPIMKVLGAKIGYLSSTWINSVLKLKLEKWNSREVVRVEVVGVDMLNRKL